MPAYWPPSPSRGSSCSEARTGIVSGHARGPAVVCSSSPRTQLGGGATPGYAATGCEWRGMPVADEKESAGDRHLAPCRWGIRSRRLRRRRSGESVKGTSSLIPTRIHWFTSRARTATRLHGGPIWLHVGILATCSGGYRPATIDGTVDWTDTRSPPSIRGLSSLARNRCEHSPGTDSWTTRRGSASASSRSRREGSKSATV